MRKSMRVVMGLVAAVGLVIQAHATDTFDVVIETSMPGEAFVFYTQAAIDLAVDWGDGSASEVFNGSANRTHSYTLADTYTISLSGRAARIAFGASGNTPKLLRDIVTPLFPAVSNITSSAAMFSGAVNITNFTCSGWFDLASGNVTSMASMFFGAKAFNQDIGRWDVSKVTDMNRMFEGATVFNQDIGRWDVGRVGPMERMFREAKAFNQDISRWDTSNATHMYAVFYNASAFNQDIGNWDVRKVTSLHSTFYGATSFKQDISGWKPLAALYCNDFMANVTLPTEYYNRLLMRWSRLSLQSGVAFSGGKSKYDLGRPAEGRQRLTDHFIWTISDGGSTGLAYKEPGTAVVVR